MARPADLRRILASNIRAALSRKKKSIVALADLADVSPAHLYDVMRCKKAATIDFVQRIASAVEVEAWQLLREEGEHEGSERRPRRSRV